MVCTAHLSRRVVDVARLHERRGETFMSIFFLVMPVTETYRLTR